MTKVCSRCRQEKPVEAFWKNRTKGDGFQARCIACQKAITKELALAFAEERRQRPGRKVCPSCGVKRFNTSFHQNGGRNDGLDVYCKWCKKKGYKASPKYRERNN